MFAKAALAASLLGASALPGLACVTIPETQRNREIALIYTGLKNPRLATADRAQAIGQRDRAQALFARRKFDAAEKERHAALIRIGYKFEPDPDVVDEPGGRPPRGTATGPIGKPGPLPRSEAKGCGSGGGRWIAPSQ